MQPLFEWYYVTYLYLFLFTQELKLLFQQWYADYGRDELYDECAHLIVWKIYGIYRMKSKKRIVNLRLSKSLCKIAIDVEEGKFVNLLRIAFYLFV